MLGDFTSKYHLSVFTMIYVSVCGAGYTFVFVYSYNMASEEQTKGLRLAVLAASLLTECMPMECLFVYVYVCICLFARHQSELSAPLPSMEIHRAKQCYIAAPSTRYHLFLAQKHAHTCTHTLDTKAHTIRHA